MRERKTIGIRLSLLETLLHLSTLTDPCSKPSKPAPRQFPYYFPPQSPNKSGALTVSSTTFSACYIKLALIPDREW